MIPEPLSSLKLEAWRFNHINPARPLASGPGNAEQRLPHPKSLSAKHLVSGMCAFFIRRTNYIARSRISLLLIGPPNNDQPLHTSGSMDHSTNRLIPGHRASIDLLQVCQPVTRDQLIPTSVKHPIWYYITDPRSYRL